MAYALTGRLAAVSNLPLGGTLSEPALAGATTLFLEDAADFDEGGGVLLLGGTETLEYASVDDASGEVYLSEPTAAAWEEGTRAEIWDPSTGTLVVETLAQVLVEGWEQSGDSLTATVDHALIPFLPEGIRDPDPATNLVGEAVVLERRGDELFVVDVLGRVPVMDGRVIDPATLPAAAEPEIPVTPGAPTVVGGFGTLMVRWAGITHPNPVVYEVHVSPTSPVVPSAATLAGEVAGTALTVRGVGSPEVPLNYSTTYHVALIAKDSLDETYQSDIGPSATGTPARVPSEAIDEAVNEAIATAGTDAATALTLGNSVLIASTTGSMIPWHVADGIVDPHIPANGTDLAGVHDVDSGWALRLNGGTETDGTLAPGAILLSGELGPDGVEGHFPVDEGAHYRILARFYASGSTPPGVPRLCTIGIRFYSTTGALLSTVEAEPVEYSIAGSVPCAAVVQAPVGAVAADVVIYKNVWSSQSVLVVNATLLTAADASLIVDGSITARALAAESVQTENLGARVVTAETLASEISLSSKFKTADAGQRVEFDVDGIRLHGPDDDVLIDLPTAPGADPTFRGSVQADGLTVRQGAAFYSPWNEFARDSVINLAEQVTGPVAAPTATIGWEGVTLERTAHSGTLGTFALSPSDIIGVGRDFRDGDNRITVMQKRPGGTRVWFYEMDGSLSDLTPAPVWDWPDWTITGVHYRSDDNNSVAFGQWHENDAWYFYVNDGTTADYQKYETIAEGLIPMSFDGAQYITAEKWDSSRYRFRRVTLGADPVTITENVYTTAANSGRPAELRFVHRGVADWGATRWTVAHADAHYRPFSSTGTYDPNSVFRAATEKGGGFWDDVTGRFYTVGTNGILYKHTALKWTDPALSTWHVGQAFADTNAAGGTHETNLGAIASFTMEQRAHVRFTLADVPFAGGSDDPNGWRLYAKRGSAPLTNRSDMKLQGTGSYLNKTFLMTVAPITTGSSALQFGTFPGASPARMRSGRTFTSDPSKAIFEVRGDGSGRWGPLEFAGDGAMTNTRDTGWVGVALINGWSAVEPVQMRYDGYQVWIRGRVTGGTAQNFGAVPSGIPLPTSTTRFVAYNHASDGRRSVTIQSSGTLQGSGSPYVEFSFYNSFIP